MNEIVKALVEHGAEFALLDPALKAAGRGSLDLAKDWIGPERLEAIKDTFQRATEKLKRRKKEPHVPPLTVLLPLLDAARDENREALRDIWASLLAAAADESRVAHFRREFIDIAKKLEPVDAVVLRTIAPLQGSHKPSRMQFIMEKSQFSQDEVIVSFDHLAKLGLLTESDNTAPDHKPGLTGLGRIFMKAIED